jgi:uncharacterized membrane protein YfcA
LDFGLVATAIVLAGIVTGLLMALFGIGGGAFIVPVLDALFARLPGVAPPPFKLAVLASLLAIGIGSGWRAMQVWRSQHFDRGALFQLVVSALPGTLLGVAVVSALTGDPLRLAFAATLAALGLWTSFGRPHLPAALTDPKVRRRRLLSIGALSGLASSMFGLGGATLLVPLLTMRAGFDTAAAATLSVVFIFVASLQSLAVYGLGVAAGVTSLAGVQAVHLELIALMTAATLLSQQFFVRVLRDLPDRLRRTLLGLYLLLAAAWLVREALVH